MRRLPLRNINSTVMVPVTLYKKRAKKLFNNSRGISERFNSIIDIFNQQFGEDHIDIQFSNINRDFYANEYSTVKSLYNYLSSDYEYCSIIIKIDRETVTNELGLSTIIYDLFIKLSFTLTGHLKFGINYKRSTFTNNQLYSRYIHSHCPSLNIEKPEAWMGVCTGTGPINSSMGLLCQLDTPIELYYGFIAELRQIIRVESLAGGPYRRIETIAGPYTKVKLLSKPQIHFDSTKEKHLKSMLVSYIKSNRLKLGCINGKICLGCTFAEWLTDFTQYALAWGKKNNVEITTQKVTIIDNNICVSSGTGASEQDINRIIGSKIITFKGTDYNLRVVDSENNTEQRELINPSLGATILKSMLDTLNYWYGNGKENNNSCTEGSCASVIFG